MNCQTRCEGSRFSPKFGRGDREHLAPDRRRVGQVRAARPLIVAEDHRAVLDRDLDAVRIASSTISGGQTSRKTAKFSAHALGLVAPHEGAHTADAKLLRRHNHLAQVIVDLLAMLEIRVQIVRVIASEEIERPRRVGGAAGSRPRARSRVDIDMADAGVAPRRARTSRPARNLDRPKAVVLRPPGDLLEWPVGEGDGQKASFTPAPRSGPAGTTAPRRRAPRGARPSGCGRSPRR